MAEGRPVKRGCSRVSYRHTGTSKCCFPGPTPPPTPAPPAPAPLPSNGITFEVGDQDCLTKHNGTISSSTDPNGEAAVAWRSPCGGVGTVTLSCAFNILGQLIAFYEQSAGGHLAEGVPVTSGCSSVSWRPTRSSRCCFSKPPKPRGPTPAPAGHRRRRRWTVPSRYGGR